MAIVHCHIKKGSLGTHKFYQAPEALLDCVGGLGRKVGNRNMLGVSQNDRFYRSATNGSAVPVP